MLAALVQGRRRIRDSKSLQLRCYSVIIVAIQS
jgi:hypothetical protein